MDTVRVEARSLLHVIELRYLPELRDAALHYFWDHGATHEEGKISLQNGWVATGERGAFVLVRANCDEEVDKTCVPLRDFEDIYYRHVTTTDEI